MPNMEIVLNNPLSGAEVKQIILNKLRDRLNADTRLADYVAVKAFEFRADVAIMLNGAIHNELEHTVEGVQGQVDQDTAKAITAHEDMPQMPPNQARVEGDLEVPVLGHDEKGRPAERGVKYAKDTLQKQQKRTGQGQPATGPELVK